MRDFSVALLLMSGILKAQFIILAPWVPDLTLIALGLFLLSILKSSNHFTRVHFSVFQITALTVFIFFCLSIIFSALYSPSEFALTKIRKFILVIFIFLIGFFGKEINLKVLTKYYVALTVFSSCMFLYIFPKLRLGLLGEEAEFYKGSYLNFGDSCAISLILMFLMIKRRNPIFYLSAILLFFALVLSGARAPLLLLVMLGSLAMSLNVISALIQNKGINAFKFVALIFASSIFFVSTVVTFNPAKYQNTEIVKTLTLSIERFSLLLKDDKGSSVNVRLTLINGAVDIIESEPFTGVGLAAYSKVALKEDSLKYPHNLFLEVWAESGIIALVLIVALIALVFYAVTVLRFEPALVLLISYCVLNSLKSQSYSDNRVMFFWFGLAIALSAYSKVTKSHRQKLTGREIAKA